MAVAAEHHPIPFAYRLPLLYIEPLLALNGAAMLLFSPTTFLSTMTPRHDSSPASASASAALFSSLSSSASSAVDALSAVRVLTDQLAIMQVVFAFNLGIVLRATRDRTVWRLLCAGMLLSDALHVAASMRELAREGTLGPSCWRPADCVNFAILGGVGLVRLAVVLGIGMGSGEVERDKQTKTEAKS